MCSTEKRYYVYWIVSGQSSYIGATVDPTKRLKQHCGVYVGGARRTRGRLWMYKCVLSGFRTWREALQMEWCFKYHTRRCRGIESRKLALDKIMSMERWTSNSPPSCEISLTIEYNPTQYGMPPNALPTPQKEPPKKANPPKATNRKWKRKLYGVTY